MKQKYLMILLTAAMLAVPASLMAQKKGKKPAKTNVVKKDSLTVLTEQAAQGDPKALNNLGLWYYTGTNVEKDFHMAFNYWSKAYNLGNAEATGNLGMCYQLGRGTKDNKSDSLVAIKLYKMAIDKGNTKVLQQHIDLADKKNNPFSIMFLLDYYTSKHDQANITKYLKKASDLGDTDSQVRQAMAYLNGKNTAAAAKLYKKLADKGNFFKGMGTNQDKAQGIQYLTRAANKGTVDAYRMLGRIYYEGDGTEKDVEKAVDYLKKAAAAKRGDSQLLLAQCYQNGEGVKKDFDQAAQWMAEAFKYGQDKDVRQTIADEKDGTFRNYIDGLKKLYVDKDYSGATDLFKKVEKAGVADGITMQAVCMADAANPKANAKKAFKMLEKVAETSTAAKLCLSQMYQDGNGVDKDTKKAAELILAAADAGNGYAQEKAGNMYFEGRGVTQDYVKAAEYYLQAEAQSKLTPTSAGNLAKCYTMGISSLPDKNKSKERIEQLKKVSSTNNLVEMLKKL